ncbi:hypothetical protein, partial [Komagataeibacter xylinus]|uniref:hypothetical protein n=1 Tax=Komagataeibacter xylinus TaxID=28448 RepID=UPI0039EB6322
MKCYGWLSPAWFEKPASETPDSFPAYQPSSTGISAYARRRVRIEDVATARHAAGIMPNMLCL